MIAELRRGMIGDKSWEPGYLDMFPLQTYLGSCWRSIICMVTGNRLFPGSISVKKIGESLERTWLRHVDGWGLLYLSQQKAWNQPCFGPCFGPIFVQWRLWVNVRKHMDGSYPMQIASEIFTSSCSSMCRSRGLHHRSYNVRPPSDVCWFRFAPVTIVISTINHSEIGVMFTMFTNFSRYRGRGPR